MNDAALPVRDDPPSPHWINRAAFQVVSVLFFSTEAALACSVSRGWNWLAVPLVVAAVARWELWPYFLWLYLAPAVIAGNLQSRRKYIEHVGMFGATPTGATRSIVDDTLLGRFVALTLLHEPFHGVHHKRAGLPHAELPLRVEELSPATPDELPAFPSYRHALRHLLRSLANPRAAAQWPES